MSGGGGGGNLKVGDGPDPGCLHHNGQAEKQDWVTLERWEQGWMGLQRGDGIDEVERRERKGCENRAARARLVTRSRRPTHHEGTDGVEEEEGLFGTPAGA